MSRRRPYDFYETPAAVTDALLAVLPLEPGARVYEPCVGDGAIVRRLPAGCQVQTNDRDRARAADTTHDATLPAAWALTPAPAWVITNPPFSAAFPIAVRACGVATAGVALLVRLSFLEPTRERGAWLAAHPPDLVRVLPRPSFTGDGRTDAVTVAWLVWYAAGTTGPRGIQIVPAPGSRSWDLFSG
jgi:hypothetical protein